MEDCQQISRHPYDSFPSSTHRQSNCDLPHCHQYTSIYSMAGETNILAWLTYKFFELSTNTIRTIKAVL